MKKSSSVLTLLALIPVLFSASYAGTWVESSQADFADGDYNANVFSSEDGADSGSLKSYPGAFYDLNKDGRPDIVICNLDGSSAYIYWGKHDWTYASDSCQYLPTDGSTGNSVADIDKDGHLDILISNYYGGFSTIYWGSRAGYTNGDTTLLQASGGHGNCIADLNHDGALDLLVSSMNGTQVYLFWGHKHERRFTQTTLSGFSSSDITVADLNKDGVLDIVVPNKQGNYPPAGGFTFSIPSYIYYGQKTQDSVFYGDASKDSLETFGAYCVSIGDVDKDGWLDIVFSNHYNGSTYNINSYIYWGSASGFRSRARRALETHSAIGNTIVDLDHDGNNDVIFANWYNDVTHLVNSYVYWGPDFSARTELPTNGGHGALVGKLSNNSVNDVLITNNFGAWSYIFHGVSRTGYLGCDSIPSSRGHISTKDNGNIHDRGNTESYVSSVFGNGTDTHRWGACSWNASIPAGAALQVLLRTGNTPDPDDGSWSGWSAAARSGAKSGLSDSKYAQYQLLTSANEFYQASTMDDFSLDYQVVTGAAAAGGPAAGHQFLSVSSLPGGGGAAIVYQITAAKEIRIGMYNIEGRLLTTLVNRAQEQGTYRLRWSGLNQNGTRVSSGVYFCRAVIGADVYCAKVVFVK